MRQKSISTGTIFIWIIIIVIISAVILIKTGLFSSSYITGKRKRYGKFTRLQLSLDLSDTKINFKKGDFMTKFRKILQLFKLNKEDKKEKLEMLKRSYEKGFISLKEYCVGLKEAGFTVESKKASEIYGEQKDKEKSESVRKQETDIEKEQKTKEEQRRIMERNEGEVLRQEAELKKEIAEKEKKEAIERKRREQEETEERNKDELKREEILKQKANEENNNSKRREFTVENSVPIPTSIIPKERILDKRVKENESFTLNNGEKLYSIMDLLNALPYVPDYVIYHHTKQGRNDFASWIGDVFQYYDIADEIRQVSEREDLIATLKKYE